MKMQQAYQKRARPQSSNKSKYHQVSEGMISWEIRSIHQGE